VSEIKRILSDKGLIAQMQAASRSFTDRDAARLLAQEVLSLALTHES
jgi:hypothetical protein